MPDAIATLTRAPSYLSAAHDGPLRLPLHRTVRREPFQTCLRCARPFKDWTKVFPDPLNAQVIAERLTERSKHFVPEIGYRTKS